MDALQKKGRACILIFAAAALLLCGCKKGLFADEAKWEDAGRKDVSGESKELKRDFFAMDTHITLTAYENRDKETKALHTETALEKAEERLRKLEGLWSVTDAGSEIYEINHSGGKPVAVSSETAKIISYALSMAEKTDGALDPTIYPVLTAWGFTAEENRVPGEDELKRLRALVDYRKAELSGNQVSLPEGMELDLGAVGKGYAGDILAELLKEEGVGSALLDLGGNIQTIGSRPDGSAFRLGIRNPFGDGTLGVLLAAEDCAAVTSGNYERYFTGEDGKEYGHIIDPSSGYPAENELASVTIIAKEGKLADALSTAMMVKGPEGAFAYWRENPDFEMLAVTKDGKIVLTEGIEDVFFVSGTFSNMETEVRKLKPSGK